MSLLMHTAVEALTYRILTCAGTANVGTQNT
jgi:hypothetical protein